MATVLQNRDVVLNNNGLKRQVALGAIYSIVTGKNDRTLMGDTNYLFRKEMMGIFEGLWGVPRPKSSLLKQLFSKRGQHVPMLNLLSWFQEQGHRVDDFSPEALAWDVARYVDVIRDAFYVGYITQETALEHLRFAHNMSRGYFRSWEDYADRFVAYKAWWDERNLRELKDHMESINGKVYMPDELYERYLAQGMTPIAEIKKAVDYLLTDRNSIWNQVAW
jgi:hypothetical protein